MTRLSTPVSAADEGLLVVHDDVDGDADQQLGSDVEDLVENRERRGETGAPVMGRRVFPQLGQRRFRFLYDFHTASMCGAMSITVAALRVRGIQSVRDEAHDFLADLAVDVAEPAEHLGRHARAAHVDLHVENLAAARCR